MDMLEIPRVEHRYLDVSGVRVFYRAVGPVGAPTMLLLHGFPASSHQFRRLMDALGNQYRLIAPDYPGFGFTETPAGFRHRFDTLAEVIEEFVRGLGLTRFGMYLFDFGAPVGFRLAVRHPEWITGLVIQNANAYEAGLSEMAREFIANRFGVPGAQERIQTLFTPALTRAQYEDGAADPAVIPPDEWTLDQHFLDRPERRQAQTDLALDYGSNVDQYPVWQEYLRSHRPPALIVWGRNDPIFTAEGAHAYLRDLPDAELHLLDAGHFALAEALPEIAPRVAELLERTGPGRSLTLAVIGATGNLGGAIAAEADRRGHRVSRLHSDTVDATDPDSVAAAVAGHDATVVAVKGPGRVVPRAAEALLAALPRAGVRRLLFVGGGASLEHAPGRRFLDSPDFPQQYRQTAQDQVEALDILRARGGELEWSYLSPPPVHLLPGPATGAYRAEARDTPITDASGQSRISVGDLAAAALDAIERRSFVRSRFTVGYPEQVSDSGS